MLCWIQNNHCYEKWSKYHGFDGNYTRMEYRRGNNRAFELDIDKDSDMVATEWENFENRRKQLINHYLAMI